MLPKLGTGAELRHAPLTLSSLRTLDIEARRQARRLRVSLPGPWKSQARPTATGTWTRHWRRSGGARATGFDEHGAPRDVTHPGAVLRFSETMASLCRDARHARDLPRLRLQASRAPDGAAARGPRDGRRPEGRPDLWRVGRNDGRLRERPGHAPRAGVSAQAGLPGRRVREGG